MELVGHRLTRASLAALTAGPDAAVARELAGTRRSRDLVLLHAIVGAAARQRHPDAAGAAAAFRLLADVERVAPAALASTLHYPPVAAWLLRTARELAGARLGPLTWVAAAAAVRGGLPTELDLTGTVEAPAGRDAVVTLPSLGSARLPAGPVRLRNTAAGAELVAGGTAVRLSAWDPRWEPVPVLVVDHLGMRFEARLDAFDGFAGVGDLHGVLLDGEPRDPHAVSAWRDRLAQAWQLLAAHHAELAAEVAELVTVLVPIRSLTGSAVAVTPSDAFGCVAMSRPPDALNMALHLAHEVQHVKLTAVTDLFPLAHETNDLFYVPWRKDPRPVFGILHGIYAHLGVTGFWRRQRHLLAGEAALRANVLYARWRSAAAEAGRDLIASGRLTALGTEFVRGVLRTLDGWRADHVPGEAARLADQLRERHRTAWRRTPVPRLRAMDVHK